MVDTEQRAADAVDVFEPEVEPLPLVFDSPHSGSAYPPDFEHVASDARIRRMEDAFVDELFAGVTRHGATLVRALFPRAYIDANRRPDDLDADLIDGEWPHALSPGPKVALGIGLIARRDLAGPLYDRKLRIDEVRARLDTCYWPYHQALEAALDEAHARHGVVWHINCHSMKSLGARVARTGDRRSRAAFCIGDRDGSSCEPALTELVVETLRERGHDVAVNDPYKGVELVTRYSAPQAGRHSLQIEINRKLYMDEMAVEKHAGFASLAADLEHLAAELAQASKAHIG